MKTLYYVADPMCSWCWGFQLEKGSRTRRIFPYISWDWRATPMTSCPMPKMQTARVLTMHRGDIHLAGHFMRLKIKGLE